jgi:hypothetical protein
MKKLILKTKPNPGETFTIDGVTFTVVESDSYLEAVVSGKEVSETLTDARSTFSEVKE